MSVYIYHGELKIFAPFKQFHEQFFINKISGKQKNKNKANPYTSFFPLQIDPQHQSRIV